ncbi:unnamed protein product [Linum trigynum]|uniref:Transcription repressor n=1 Tax=Linum trigynum TaxID=586398 RepID=A0AAV2CV87_9ROSI
MGKKKMRTKPNPFTDQSPTSSINKPSSSSSPSSSCSSPSSASTSTWPWPPYYYCHQQPRTLSFRTTTSADKPISTATAMSKPTGPTSIGPDVVGPGPGNTDASFDDDPAAVETVIRGLKQSDRRRLFSPDETSSSILRRKDSSPTAEEEADRGGDGGGGGGENLLYPFNDGGAAAVALTLDSRDPFEDFKASMAEMVEAHALRDWESLEQLLGCYLKVNGRSNHGYIVGAFVDLLAGGLFFKAAEEEVEELNCSCSNRHKAGEDLRRHHYSPSSPLSFYTSFSSSSCSEDSSSTPCVSSLEAYREAAEGDDELDEISTAAFRGEKERGRESGSH